MGAVIVRYAEVGLKGHNRMFFERRLVKNIKFCLKKHGLDRGMVRRIRGRILVDAGEEAIKPLMDVFGITSLSYAEIVEPEIDDIKKAALEFALKRQFDSFRVTAQRVNVKFPLDSMAVQRLVGEVVFETLNKRVDLHSPELNIHVEISDKAYIFADKVECHAGLPVGSEGRVLCLMDGGLSNLAAVMMMKRGCSVLPVGLKEIELKNLQRYYPSDKLRFKHIGSYSEIDSLAKDKKIKAIVVADTVEDIRDYGCRLLVLRPLVGMDNDERTLQQKRFFG